MAGDDDAAKGLMSPYPEKRIRAAEKLFEEVSYNLFRLFRAKGASEEQAADLVQQAFERLCSTLNKEPLKNASNPKGFFYTITDNLWKDWIRSDKRQPPALPWS